MLKLGTKRGGRRGLRFLAGLLVAFALVGAGCGGSDEGDSSGTVDAADPETGDDEATEGDDAVSAEEPPADEASASGATPDLGDFPIPAAPGGEFFAETSTGAAKILAYPMSEFATVAAFYEEWANEATPGDDPPMTLIIDEAEMKLAISVLVSETELHQVIAGQEHGELRVSLTVTGG